MHEMNNPHLPASLRNTYGIAAPSPSVATGAFIPRLKTGVPVGSTPEGAGDLKSHRSEAGILLFPTDK